MLKSISVIFSLIAALQGKVDALMQPKLGDTLPQLQLWSTTSTQAHAVFPRSYDVYAPNNSATFSKIFTKQGVSGNCLQYGANGIGDAGAPCGSGSGSGNFSGTGTPTWVSFFDGTHSVTGSADFTWDNNTKTLNLNSGANITGNSSLAFLAGSTGEPFMSWDNNAIALQFNTGGASMLLGDGSSPNKFYVSSDGSHTASLDSSGITSLQTYAFPDKSGTFALTSDITGGANFSGTSTNPNAVLFGIGDNTHAASSSPNFAFNGNTNILTVTGTVTSTTLNAQTINGVNATIKGTLVLGNANGMLQASAGTVSVNAITTGIVAVGLNTSTWGGSVGNLYFNSSADRFAVNCVYCTNSTIPDAIFSVSSTIGAGGINQFGHATTVVFTVSNTATNAAFVIKDNTGAQKFMVSVAGTATAVNIVSTGKLSVGAANDATRPFYVTGDVSGGVATIERTNAATTGSLGTMIIKGTSTGQMAQGFGSAFQFALQDADGVENLIANLQGIRRGADNTGFLQFATVNAGSTVVGGAFDENGNLIVGSVTTVATTSKLTVQGGSQVWGNATSVGLTVTNLNGLAKCVGVTPCSTASDGTDYFSLTALNASSTQRLPNAADGTGKYLTTDGSTFSWGTPASAASSPTSWMFLTASAITPTSSVSGIFVSPSSTLVNLNWTNATGTLLVITASGVQPNLVLNPIVGGYFLNKTNNYFGGLLIQNTSTGSIATANWLTGNDQMTNTKQFLEGGVNGSGYNDASFAADWANGAFIETSNDAGQLNISVSGSGATQRVNFLLGNAISATSNILGYWQYSTASPTNFSVFGNAVFGTATTNNFSITGLTSGSILVGGGAGGPLTVTGTVATSKGGTGTGTSFTLGSLVFAGASGVYTQDNASFFVDDTNNRFGIGNAVPDAFLSVSQSKLNGLYATDVSIIVNSSATSPAFVIKNNSAVQLLSQSATGALIVAVTSDTKQAIRFQNSIGDNIFTMDSANGWFNLGATSVPDRPLRVGPGTNLNVNPNVNFLIQDRTDARIGAAVADQGIFMKATGGIYSYDYNAGAARDMYLQEFGAKVGVGYTQNLPAYLSVSSSGITATGFQLTVNTGNTKPAFAVVNSGLLGLTPTYLMQISSTGSIVMSDQQSTTSVNGAVPTLSSCGTGTPTVAGNDYSGTITAGGGALLACTLTFAHVKPNTQYSCWFTSVNAALSSFFYTKSTTAIVINATSLTGAVVDYGCLSYK